MTVTNCWTQSIWKSLIFASSGERKTKTELSHPFISWPENSALNKYQHCSKSALRLYTSVHSASFMSHKKNRCYFRFVKTFVRYINTVLNTKLAWTIVMSRQTLSHTDQAAVQYWFIHMETNKAGVILPQCCFWIARLCHKNQRRDV